MNWLVGEWSQLHRITDRVESPWFNSCENKPGVYRLVALQSANSLNPMLLGRVCGQDITGSLYIGATANLRARIGALVKTNDPRFLSKGHRVPPKKLTDTFGPDRLAVCFEYVDDKAFVFIREHDLMEAYKSEFGETPPLNRQG